LGILLFDGIPFSFIAVVSLPLWSARVVESEIETSELVSIQKRQALTVRFVTCCIQEWVFVFQAHISPQDDLVFSSVIPPLPIYIKPQGMESVKVGKSYQMIIILQPQPGRCLIDRK
jgi:hypothetical protein